MAWHVKAPDAKSDDLSSAPGPHMVEGERESNELNMNGDLGKGDILPSHLFKKYVSSKKHGELLPRENNWPRFYSCQAFSRNLAK